MILQWFEKLVGGLRMIDKEELKRKGAVCGWDMNSFVINVQTYLPWCVLYTPLSQFRKREEKSRS